MFLVSIPGITDEEMMRRYECVKPVVMMNGKLHYLREYTLEELKSTSYLFNKVQDVRQEVDSDELEIWEGKDFLCLHEYGRVGLFKPSVGEVLSQMAGYYTMYAKAFEIIQMPKVVEDFHKDALSSIAFENGYYVSVVRLYKGKEKK